MRAIEQSTEFVKRYPMMFTENKEWWATMSALEIIEAQKRSVKEFADELTKRTKR